MRIKKGSKRIRLVLEKRQQVGISQNMMKYSELTETIINAEYSQILNSSWGFSYLANSTKTFIFKLHNGLLGLNHRVAHFVRDVPRTCTFCDLLGVPEEHSETTSHLFFDCESVEVPISLFYGWLLNSPDPYFLRRSDYFAGFELEQKNKIKTLHVVNLLVKKFIWDCKLRFTVPRFLDMKNWIVNDIRRMTMENRSFREMVNQSNLDNLIAEIRF